jgi:amino acid transporter
MSRAALVLIALAVGLTAYIAVPSLMALVRQHPERRLIYKLSPLSLLSFMLWLVLVVWAFTGQRDDAIISRYVSKLRSNNRLPIAITLLVLFGLAGSLLPLLR